MRNWIPNLINYKNEVVFWLALIVGGGQFLITQIDDAGIENVNDVYGLIVVAVGLFQRMGAFGKESVAAIEARYEDR